MFLMLWLCWVWFLHMLSFSECFFLAYDRFVVYLCITVPKSKVTRLRSLDLLRQRPFLLFFVQIILYNHIKQGYKFSPVKIFSRFFFIFFCFYPKFYTQNHRLNLYHILHFNHRSHKIRQVNVFWVKRNPWGCRFIFYCCLFVFDGLFL